MPAILDTDSDPAAEQAADPAHLFHPHLREFVVGAMTIEFTADADAKAFADRDRRVAEACSVHEELRGQLDTLPAVREFLQLRGKVNRHRGDADVRAGKLRAEIERLEAKYAAELEDLESPDLAGRVGSVERLLDAARQQLSESAKGRDVLDKLLAQKRPPAARELLAHAVRSAEARQRELRQRQTSAFLALAATAGPELDELLTSSRALVALEGTDLRAWAENFVAASL